MSHSLHTEYLELSQFTATDKPAWLTDYNTDMAKIDEHISEKDVENHEYQRNTDVHLGEIDESIEALQNADGVLGDRCTSLEDRMDIAETKIEVNKQNIQDNKNDITELQENVSDLMNGHGIADKAITTQMLADHSVTTEKLAYNSVTTDEILNETIQWEDTSPDFKRHITDLDASTLDSAKGYTDQQVSSVRSDMSSGNQTIQNQINQLSQSITNLTNNMITAKDIYPVGALFLAMGNVNPNNLFSGTTWQRQSGGVLYIGNGSNDGTTVGNDSVTLSLANMPSHNHSVTPTGSVSLSGSGNVNTTPLTGAPQLLDSITHVNILPRVLDHVQNPYNVCSTLSVNTGVTPHRTGDAQNSPDPNAANSYYRDYIENHVHEIDLSSITNNISATLSLNTVNTDSKGNCTAISVKQAGVYVSVWKRTA